VVVDAAGASDSREFTLAIADPLEVVLRAATATRSGAWRVVDDVTAAGGQAVWHPDAGAAKLLVPLAAPVHTLELTFAADAGQGYRLWMRGRAERNLWSNDSVFVQFDGSVTVAGAPQWRIGTTSATVVSIEEGISKGLSGWGWADNKLDGAGPLVYFERSGPQTIRIQTREDGLTLDQIVLSAGTYLTTAPGVTKNDTTILP
jgi:hypothetical protein